MTLSQEGRPPRRPTQGHPGAGVALGVARFATFIAGLTITWSGFKVGAATLADASVLVALVLWAFALLLRGDRLPLRLWMIAPSLCAFFVFSWQVIVAGADPASANSAVQPYVLLVRVILSTAGVMLLALAVSVGSARPIRDLWTPMLIGSSASALFAILQMEGLRVDWPFLEQTVSDFSGRYAGFSSHPNSLAQTAVLAAVVAMYFLGKKSLMTHVLGVISLLLAAGAIGVSGSRAGIILLVVVVFLGAAAAVLVRFGSVTAVVFVVGAACILIVFLPGLLSGTRLGGEGSVGVELSNFGRVEALAAGWEAFESSPLIGVGLGSWYGEMGALVMLAGGGILLGGAYLHFTVAMGWSLVRRWRSTPERFGLIALVAVIGFGLLNNGIFERFTFWVPCAAAAVALMSGLGAKKTEGRVHS